MRPIAIALPLTSLLLACSSPSKPPPKVDQSGYTRAPAKKPRKKPKPYDELMKELEELDRKRDPKLTQANELWKQGNEQAQAGDNQGAVRSYTEAVSVYPDHRLARQNRGIIFQSQGQHQKAIADFTGVLETKNIAEFPKEIAEARTLRAQSYMATRKLREAIADCDHALKIAPKYEKTKWVCLQSRGYAKIYLMDTKGAVADLDQVLRSGVRNPYYALWIAALGGEPGFLRGYSSDKSVTGLLARLYLGKGTPQGVVAAADNGDRPLDRITARLFVALYEDWKGTPKNARHWFEQFLAEPAARRLPESIYVRGRLKALGN